GGEGPAGEGHGQSPGCRPGAARMGGAGRRPEGRARRAPPAQRRGAPGGRADERGTGREVRADLRRGAAEPAAAGARRAGAAGARDRTERRRNEGHWTDIYLWKDTGRWPSWLLRPARRTRPRGARRREAGTNDAFTPGWSR